jgi:uncharacterized repeat protein (TIGR03803 family)
MMSPTHPQRWISRTCPRSATVALVLAVTLELAVFAAQSLQGQGFETIYSFAGGVDGANPYASLIRDKKGTLYSTTTIGGSSSYGTVFALSKSGKETMLHSFTRGRDGGIPVGSVIRDSAGALYGTTQVGGDSKCDCGVIFKIPGRTPTQALYIFTGATDGANPFAALIMDKAGNLYGTTEFGGAVGQCFGGLGCGVVFKVDQNGNEAVLHTFTGSGGDGANPTSALIQDKHGNFYGTTLQGGDLRCSLGNGSGCGTVFKISKTGRETVLYRFAGGTDGAFPIAGVTLDAAGVLYGTTQAGGDSSKCFPGCGTVFKLDITGAETVLYRFTGGTDGATPFAGVIVDETGNLYGAAMHGGNSDGNGAVYKIDTAGKEIVLHTFSGPEGYLPRGGLIRDAKGRLYGTTSGGGTSGFGTVFRITP